jgi:hypothetical protein
VTSAQNFQNYKLDPATCLAHSHVLKPATPSRSPVLKEAACEGAVAQARIADFSLT